MSETDISSSDALNNDNRYRFGVLRMFSKYIKKATILAPSALALMASTSAQAFLVDQGDFENLSGPNNPPYYWSFDLDWVNGSWLDVIDDGGDRGSWGFLSNEGGGWGGVWVYDLNLADVSIPAGQSIDIIFDMIDFDLSDTTGGATGVKLESVAQWCPSKRYWRYSFQCC